MRTSNHEAGHLACTLQQLSRIEIPCNWYFGICYFGLITDLP
jgi:hypothetical protein